MYWAFQVLVVGRSLPDTSAKERYYREYTFSASPNRTSQMDLVQHGDAFKEAQRAAGYAPNGLVTHRSRHEVPTTMRVVYDASNEELSVMCDWDQSIRNQVYARLPSGSMMARLAGCPSRQGYIVFWLLLKPSELADFRSMVADIYPHVPQLLDSLRRVCCLQRNDHPLAEVTCIFAAFRRRLAHATL